MREKLNKVVYFGASHMHRFRRKGHRSSPLQPIRIPREIYANLIESATPPHLIAANIEVRRI